MIFCIKFLICCNTQKVYLKMASFDEIDGFPIVPGMQTEERSMIGPIEINVGGTIYCTSVSTLTKYPNSYFASRFSGRFRTDLETDSKGRIFIDRDGGMFRHILNFLRTGRIFLPESMDQIHLYHALMEEAEFFILVDLSEIIKETTNRLSIEYEQLNMKRHHSAPRIMAAADSIASAVQDAGLQRFASPRSAPGSAKLAANAKAIELDFDTADELAFEGADLDF